MNLAREEQVIKQNIEILVPGSQASGTINLDGCLEQNSPNKPVGAEQRELVLMSRRRLRTSDKVEAVEVMTKTFILLTFISWPEGENHSNKKTERAAA